MRVPENGIPAEELIAVVKNSLKRAGLSAAPNGPVLRVSAVQLILRVVTETVIGAGVDIRVPFVGMRLKTGVRVTKQDTQTLDLTLVPPDLLARAEIRDGDVEDVLVGAITKIRSVVASAAAGDDPWVLAAGTIDLTFVVTESGQISLGIDADATAAATQTLRLTLCSPDE
jgi:hypothetical protein